MIASFDYRETLQGIALLESKFQRFLAERPEAAEALRSIAREAAGIQGEIRSLIDEMTAVHCPGCATPCCQSLPVQGWFSESDYYVYRMLHEPPEPLLVSGGPALGCRFLGRGGCVLPGDARPFACVKVNCRALSEALEQEAMEDRFSRLSARLDALQRRIWTFIR